MSWNWIDKLAELDRADVGHALVTITHVDGSAPREPGAKIIVTDDAFYGTVGGGHLEALVLADARAAIATRASTKARYPLGAKAGQCCGGVVEVFIEVLGSAPVLHVFGAGHVAQALMRVLSGTRFKVHVVDEREEWLAHLPPGAVAHDEPWERYVAAMRCDAQRAYAIVMTHRHDLDEDIVFALCRKPLRYLGLIGSRTKWKRFAHRLELRGASPAEIARVTCPIGIALAGKAPQEVAISAAAQLLELAEQTRAAPALITQPAER
ncbi:MAG: xanthine dehydrogenase accessory protein XdhC [Deltaproteobacteria bacterium]|nr:xanthine dehydrogenase accessory protein XdhC [Deltaproteobacteria bacterium]